MNAREVALNALYKINMNNAYSNIALDNEIKKSGLDARDISFASRLVYGVVTYKLLLEYIVKKYSSIKFEKISPWVLYSIYLGIYQIIFMNKVPMHAIVNESVELAKKHSNKGGAGFTNAILKKVSKDEIQNLTFENEVDKISILTSHEKWFVQKLIDQYGLDEARKICDANNIEPPIYVRVNTLKISKDELKKEFESIGINSKDAEVKDTLIIDNIENLERNELFQKGYFTIQDNAASLASIVLAPNEGDTVLDICGAPGGKTTHMAELMNNKGRIICGDIYENRLKMVDEAANRLGIDIIKTKVMDGTKLNEELIDTMDKVLVDAPCSGFGVIRRKVDIKYQRKEEDLKEIVDIQKQILDNASKYLKIGGELVYSTCTIFKEENENVVDEFLENNPNFEKVGEYINKLPHKDNMDGFFIAKIVRRK